MKKCPKCGLPAMDGVVVCDCGYVLKAVFGTEPERGAEPDIASSVEPARVIRTEPARFSPPVRADSRKAAGNWEHWLVIFGILMAFRFILNWQSHRPLLQPSSTASGRRADSPLTAEFSLSSASGRFEQLKEDSREILRKYLTQEEYDFMIEMSKKQNQSGVMREEFNRVSVLMKKIDSMATAKEKAKLAELRGLLRRLAGQMK